MKNNDNKKNQSNNLLYKNNYNNKKSNDTKSLSMISKSGLGTLRRPLAAAVRAEFQLGLQEASWGLGFRV